MSSSDTVAAEEEHLAETAESATDSRAVAPTSWLGYLVMPAFIGLCLIGLYLYVEGLRPLGFVESGNINADVIRLRLVQHLQLTIVSTLIVLAVAIPLGILLTRPSMRNRGITPVAVAVANTGQAIPSIGLMVLLGGIISFGFRTAVIALAAYTVVPVLRNTMVGLEQVDRFVMESARGMGMSKRAVLTRIELPLAVPVIMAGVRTALVINVGTAALATFINGGGLGFLIYTGIALRRISVLIVGAVLTALLALAVDWLAGIAEDYLRPKGLRARAS